MKLPRMKRLFRLSLRTMLVVISVLCVLLGAKVRQVKQQKEAVVRVQEMGGLVIYDYEYNNGKRVSGAKRPGPKWLRELIGADYFATVVHVNLNDAEVTDLSPLANLTELRTLDVCVTEVTREEATKLNKALPDCRILPYPYE